MKKTVIKLIALALVVALVMPMTACKKKKNNGDGEFLYDEPAVYEGTHVMTAPDTAVDMVVNGETDYILVYPAAGLTTEMRTARDEFAYLFQKATGATISSTSDGAQHSAGAKVISLGETTQFLSSGLSYDKQALGLDGVRIITKDNSVYILGGSDYGVIYGVYDFMQICFNYESYYRNCMEIDRVENLKLKNFDVTDLPDITLRNYSNGQVSTSYNNARWYETEAGLTTSETSNIMHRLRLKDRSTFLMPIHSAFSTSSASANVHNTDEYIAGATGSYVADWKSNNGNQLCYTTRGDAEAWEALAQWCAKKLEFSLESYKPADYPYRNYATLTMEDNGNYCTCDWCVEQYEKDNKSYAGAVIRLCNRIMEIVDEWMNDPKNADSKRENFVLLFFSYNYLANVPVVTNEKGEFLPASTDVVCRDDVGVFYCWNYGNCTRDVYDSANDESRTNSKKWATISNTVWYWLYSVSYTAYEYFFDTFNFINSESFNFLANNHADYFFFQGKFGTEEVSTYDNLEEYLVAKLAWNANLDVKELTKNYFAAMYGDAADAMFEIFSDTRLHSANLAMNESYVETHGGSPNKPQFFPYSTYLRPMADKYENALSIIEPLSITDNSSYILIKTRIELEYLAVLYQILELYGSSAVMPFTAEQKSEYVQKLRDILKNYKVAVREGRNGVTPTVNDWVEGL